MYVQRLKENQNQIAEKILEIEIWMLHPRVIKKWNLVAFASLIIINALTVQRQGSFPHFLPFGASRRRLTPLSS